jgi:hypothetical protein
VIRHPARVGQRFLQRRLTLRTGISGGLSHRIARTHPSWQRINWQTTPNLRPAPLVILDRLLFRQPPPRSLTKNLLASLIKQPARSLSGDRVTPKVVGDNRDRSGAKKLGQPSTGSPRSNSSSFNETVGG